MSKTVRAQDIAPAAFAPKPDVNDKEDDLVYDLGNMAASDTHPLHPQSLMKDRETYLMSSARDNAQLLINQIFSLPISRDPAAGILATLPPSNYSIPREKHVPEVKPLTKWEAFAKQKGIKKKKTSRKVYDADADDYKPVYGYGAKGNKDMSDWIVEMPDDDDGSVDPRAKAKLEKTSRVLKNQLSQVKNVDRAANLKKIKGKGKDRDAEDDSRTMINLGSKAPVGIPTGAFNNSKVKFGKGKAGSSKLLNEVAVSTASMGRFDERVKGEGDRVKTKSKRNKFDDNTKANTRNRDMSVLASIIGGEEGSKIRKLSAAEDNGGSSKKKRKMK